MGIKSCSGMLRNSFVSTPCNCRGILSDPLLLIRLTNRRISSVGTRGEVGYGRGLVLVLRVWRFRWVSVVFIDRQSQRNGGQAQGPHPSQLHSLSLRIIHCFFCALM